MPVPMLDRDEWMRRLGPLYPGLVALKCVTRLPVATSLIPAGDDLVRSAKWFTAAAGAVGLALAALAWVLSAVGMVHAVVAGAVTLAAVIATRALYESGLARTVDALWGGGADDDGGSARISAYGATAIMGVVGLRALGLMGTEPGGWTWVGALVTSQMLSRWCALLLTAIGDHLEHPAPERTPLLVGDVSWESLAVAGAPAALSAIVFAGLPGVAVIAVTVAVAFAIGLGLQRHLGGLTSDSLAAACAMCEVTVLVLLAAVSPATTSPFTADAPGAGASASDVVTAAGVVIRAWFS